MPPKTKKSPRSKKRGVGRPRKYKVCISDGDTGYRNFYKKGNPPSKYPKVCRYQCPTPGHRRWRGVCGPPKYSKKKLTGIKTTSNRVKSANKTTRRKTTTRKTTSRKTTTRKTTSRKRKTKTTEDQDTFIGPREFIGPLQESPPKDNSFMDGNRKFRSSKK